MGIDFFDFNLLNMFEQDPDKAYHNGVMASRNTEGKTESINDHRINEIYSEQYTNGLLYGMSLSDEEFEAYKRERERKSTPRDNTIETWHEDPIAKFARMLGIGKDSKKRTKGPWEAFLG